MISILKKTLVIDETVANVALTMMSIRTRTQTELDKNYESDMTVRKVTRVW